MLGFLYKRDGPQNMHGDLGMGWHAYMEVDMCWSEEIEVAEENE